MPQGIRNSIRSRLSLVDEAGLKLLQATAIVGRSFEINTIQAVSGRSEEETIGDLDDLLRFGLIRVINKYPDDGLVGFSHDVHYNQFRGLIYQGTSLAITLAQTGLNLCRQVGGHHCHTAIENNLADFSHVSGQVEEAIIQLKQAVVLYAEIGEDSDHIKPGIWKLTEW